MLLKKNQTSLRKLTKILRPQLFTSRRRRKETSGVQGAIRALNLEGRLTESKYNRSLAALL